MDLRLAVLAAGLLAGNVALAQVPAKVGDWPQWRGPNRDGISADGPKVVWQVDSVGVGYSSIIVKDGRIYTQGDLDGVEHVIALDAADGKVVWAVQPGPVKSLLADRLANEMKQLDRDKDGVVDELEALQRFGWDFTKFDKPAGGDVEGRAKARAIALFAKVDKQTDVC